MQIKIALPKGRLQETTAALLHKANWGLEDYHEKARFYQPKSQKLPSLFVKVFHEKDIPIQVAVGNYDLGICGLDWVEELLAKYPSSALVKVKDLGYGENTLYMAASLSQGVPGVEQIRTKSDIIEIASEYPNLAESFALRSRLSRFSIFPVWGGAEAYPPESADLALIAGSTETQLNSRGLTPVSKVLDSSAFLVANRNSWKSRDLGEVVASICDGLPVNEEKPMASVTRACQVTEPHFVGEKDEGMVRMALPDGHQQVPTAQLLNKAGITFNDYPSAAGNRRPAVNLQGVVVKVIRPQDMPLQVANGNFDVAITGRDWLKEHLYQFPSSPVRELLDLKFGKVKIVAVVSQELPSDVSGLRGLAAERSEPLRVASEYTNIADKYARDNHLGPYRVVPTWGATEAFLPEDADLLIENTETGRTIARHKLKIISTLFESTACLIGNANGKSGKNEKIKSITKILQTALEGA
ncbi:ATP phosphoribosyltransferase [Chloroflexota bacterium]